MKLETFRISLNNSSSTYTPGQDVSGEVVIDPGTRELETQGLVFKFQGTASVQLIEHLKHGKGPPLRVKHHANSNVLKHRTYLLGDGLQTLKLSQVETTLPFTFTLPSLKIPGSFEGKHGKVEYVLKAKLKQKGSNKNFEIKKEVLVTPVVDLNLDPILAQPMARENSKNVRFLFWVNGSLTMSVKVGATGFCLGENLPFLVEVNNGSPRKTKNVSALLLQEVTYTTKRKQIQSYEELAKATTNELEAGPGDGKVWRGTLLVPRGAARSSQEGECALLAVRYFLKVVCNASDVGSNLQLELPITIGTVPIRNVDLSVNLSNSTVPVSVLTP